MIDRSARPAKSRPLGVAVALLRLVLGGVFLYASIAKIADPAGFARAVAQYRLAPAALLHPFALVLPWVEALCGFALIVGVARRGAAWLTLLMCGLFAVAIGSALIRDLDISCGCFHTTGGEAIGLGLLARDLLTLAASALVIALHRHDRFAPAALLERRLA